MWVGVCWFISLFFVVGGWVCLRVCCVCGWCVGVFFCCVCVAGVCVCVCLKFVCVCVVCVCVCVTGVCVCVVCECVCVCDLSVCVCGWVGCLGRGVEQFGQ